MILDFILFSGDGEEISTRDDTLLKESFVVNGHQGTTTIFWGGAFHDAARTKVIGSYVGAVLGFSKGNYLVMKVASFDEFEVTH